MEIVSRSGVASLLPLALIRPPSSVRPSEERGTFLPKGANEISLSGRRSRLENLQEDVNGQRCLLAYFSDPQSQSEPEIGVERHFRQKIEFLRAENTEIHFMAVRTKCIYADWRLDAKTLSLIFMQRDRRRRGEHD